MNREDSIRLYGLLNGLEKKKKIKKLNIFCYLCIDELKCPDLIGKQSQTNDTSPGKELMEKWIFNY